MTLQTRKTAGIEKNLKERNRIERDGAGMEKEQQSKVKNGNNRE